jgi:hypothetical protein
MDINQDDVQQAMAPAMDSSADPQTAAYAGDSQSAPAPGPALGDPDNPMLASVSAAAPGTPPPWTARDVLDKSGATPIEAVKDMWNDSQAMPGQIAGAMAANQSLAEANAYVNASKVGADFKSGNMFGMISDTASLGRGIVSDEASMLGSGASTWMDGAERVAWDPMRDIVGGDTNAIIDWLRGAPKY